MAAERGLTLDAFAALAEGDDAIDRALDARLTDRARQGDVLLESRLAGWLATQAGLAGLRVWIECEEAERARRVGGRDGHHLDGALEANRAREASERARYLGYYGIDLADRSVYDLILDSTGETPEELARRIVTAATA